MGSLLEGIVRKIEGMGGVCVVVGEDKLVEGL